MRAFKIFLILSFIVIFVSCDDTTEYSQHPNVGLTAKAAHEINASLGNMPILDASFDKLKSEVEAELANGMDVPVPKDPAGGYTHNRHKQNYITMYGASTLWQITEEKKYASFVKEMLLQYAQMYPSLSEHPVKASYAPGKIFWQSLNDAVWLVYTSQAYDCIYDYLSADERATIENNLLIPYCNFLSVESTHVFNRVHNHGVWAVAAVGMTGFAMENEEMVERAFYGIKTKEVRDNETAGFFVQLNELFSPDGYYTEGPYYQRYALLPYLLFAQAINNNMPEKKIFEYRDEILKKAVLTTLQLTNTDGRFFPINDALKEMSFKAPELINGVNIIYDVDRSNKSLLGIAQKQNEIILSQSGLAVAKAISNGEAKPFEWFSCQLLDGSKGKQGAIGVLRSGPDSEQALVMKYASQGLGHGHFDRLGIMFYDKGKEILQDYGAARYVNIEYKHGGRYLPENNTWGKQSIAHNTITIDEVSHFNGDWKLSQKTPSEAWFFGNDSAGLQIMSAKETNAYRGVVLQRTIAMIKDASLFENGLILDVLRGETQEQHTYDLPFYYQGQLLFTNANYTANATQLSTFGTDYGYQHLWLEAEGAAGEKNTRFLWQNGRSFYTVVSETTTTDRVNFVRIGANDPELSLRHEPAFVIRKKGKDPLYVSTIEAHGDKNPVTEIANNINGNVESVETMYNDMNYTLVKVSTKNKQQLVLAICNSNNEDAKSHNISIKGETYQWAGAYKLFK